MPDKVKFDASLLKGRENKNLVDVGGYFALAPDLQPQLLPLEKLTVALPYNFGEGHMMVSGLLAIATNRRVEFLFVKGDAPESAYEEADICLLDLSPLWSQDNDMWEVALGILRNTPWFLAEFKEETVAESFFRKIWNQSYDGLDDRIKSTRLSHRKIKTVAEAGISHMKERVSLTLKLARAYDTMQYAVREEMHKEDRQGVLIVPEESARIELIILLEWIGFVQKEDGLDKTNPTYVVIMHKETDDGELEWQVYPALQLGDDGLYDRAPNMEYPFTLTEPLKKVGCSVSNKYFLPHVVCPNAKAAFAVATWIDSKRQRKHTKLEDLFA